MGSASKRVTVTRRYEYRILSPVPHVEIVKALHWASEDFKEVHDRPADYDDDIWLVGDEEGVTVYFEAKGDPSTKGSSDA